jgi:hypothetical protein
LGYLKYKCLIFLFIPLESMGSTHCWRFFMPLFAQSRALSAALLMALSALNAPSVLAQTPSAEAATLAPLAQGSPFPSLSLTDQHDKPVTLPGTTHALVYANAKAVDEWVNPVLTDMGPANLSAKHVIYLSDISRMPWMVSKMIALPQMRERTYSAALIRNDEEKALAGMPIPAKDCADVFILNAGIIASIQSVCSPAALKSELEALPVAASH